VLATDEAEGVKTAHRLWATEGLPGELSRILPAPEHFEQGSALVTEEMTAKAVPCGSDVGRHVQHLRAYVDAGYDEVYVQQIGPEQEGFFDFYAEHVLPELR